MHLPAPVVTNRSKPFIPKNVLVRWDQTEQKLTDILTNHPMTGDAQAAVDRAMGWGTAETRQFVDELIERGLIHFVPVVRNGPIYDPKSFWKAGARAKTRIIHAGTETGDRSYNRRRDACP